MSNFQLFGLSHGLVVSLIAALTVTLICWCRCADEKTKNTIRICMAACCLLSFPIQVGLSIWSGHQFSIINKIPLHLCDLAAICGGIALLTRSQKFGELTYFWGLAGTLQGLITPDLGSNFPSAEFISFFWNHGFVVITALFLPLALGWRPRTSALWFVFAITQIYMVVAMTINFLFETNYGFLRHKPEHPTPLDSFPDWPWYIIVLEFLCLTLFILLNLPFYRKSVK